MALDATLRCRRIVEADIDSVTTLLARGFPSRNRGYWLRALQVLTRRQPPPGFPKYGNLIESNGVPVGVILLIWTVISTADGDALRCNVSSWYVEPGFRAYASLLVSQALRVQDATYLNISPAANTWTTIEAQGFLRYCDGLFVAVPTLNEFWGRARAKVFGAKRVPEVDFDPYDLRLLAEHSVFGCISLWCATAERAHPFIFRRRNWHTVPAVHLIYCHDVDDFVRFAGPIGRFLALRGLPFVIVDANGRIPGLAGIYLRGRPKYYKGPIRPRLGDLAYTEFALFGP